MVNSIFFLRLFKVVILIVNLVYYFILGEIVLKGDFSMCLYTYQIIGLLVGCKADVVVGG